MDINADGLPDMVKGNNVYFNTGTGFAPSVEWTGLGALDKGESVGQSANAGFTVGITIPIVVAVLKICVNPTGSVSSGVSHTLTQLADIDGDGMPDFLSSDRENELNVKSSRIFRTNLLKTVENPLGSNFILDYLLTPAIYTHPGGKMALKSVKIYDGLAGDGIDTTFTSFEYEDGFYSRHERKFYGFSSVKTHFHNTGNQNTVYRTVVQKFSNRDYYTNGIMLEETTDLTVKVVISRACKIFILYIISIQVNFSPEHLPKTRVSLFLWHSMKPGNMPIEVLRNPLLPQVYLLLTIHWGMLLVIPTIPPEMKKTNIQLLFSIIIIMATIYILFLPNRK